MGGDSCCRRGPGMRCNTGVRYVLVLTTVMALLCYQLYYLFIPLYLQLFPREPIDTAGALHWTGRQPVRGDPYWQRVDNEGQAFVYSAHYDDIEWPPLIRVIALAEDPLPYFFVTCRYYGHHDGPVIANVTGTLRHLRDRNGRRYLGAYIECPLKHRRPAALTLDRGNQNNALNYMHVHYSRLATWPPQPGAPPPSAPLQPLTQNPEEEDEEDGEDDSESRDLEEDEEGGEDDPESRDLSEDQEPEPPPSSESEEGRGRGPHTPGYDAEDRGFLWNVTRCFPAFQLNYDDHVMLAEVVAMSRLLGVDHFVFYVQHTGPRVLHMLKILQRDGDVEVHPWNMNLPEGVLYYAGQFASINDCLHRHVHTSRYLLFGDVDELFVQRQHASLPQLLIEQFSRNEECGAFLFLNVFFNLELPTAALPQLNGTQSKQLQRLQMLTHTRRHVEALDPGDRSKPAVDPRKVKTGSVHVIETLRQGFESCVMDPSQGLLHHYRKYDVPAEDKLMDDPYLWDIFPEFLEEISYILDQYDDSV